MFGKSTPTAHTSHRVESKGWSKRAKVASAILGAVIAGGTAYAATNWTVGLASGSNGQAQSATVSNLTIVAQASPAATNLLYPGNTGDVVAKISNPNSFPVTITAVNLPTSSVYASGFSDSTLSAAQSGCTSTTSLVSWTGATSTSGSSHLLATPIVVAANGNTTITFTNEATMNTSSPAACEGTYFSMPSLTGVAASGGAATATVATTDTWS